MGLVWFGLPRQAGLPQWQTLLLIGLVAPILEEVVFRGGLQPLLANLKPLHRQFGLGVSVSNVITSVIFALFHLINQPALWAMLVFIPSLAFGWLKDRHISVVPSIVLHAVYNLGFVLLFLR